MTTFLSIGECMVEMAPAGDGHYAMGFAGDTFNTAWYARRALPSGTAVAYLTAVGTDATSQAMLDFMAEAGVEPEGPRIEGRTVGLYLIRLAKGERSFSYWRDTSAARLLAQGLDTLPRVSGPGDLAYFSGITLAILAPPDREALLARLADARAAGVTIAFDPNLRPRLWQGGDEMREWVTRGAAVADIALPSFDDEAGHFGDPAPEATAARYREAGCPTVVVKNGAGTVFALGPGGPVRVDPEPVAEVVDTTAAGDFFNAAVLAALMGGEPLAAAVAAGCRLAAHVVTSRGALVG